MGFFKFVVPIDGIINFIVKAHNKQQAVEYFENLDDKDLKYLICECNNVLISCKNVQKENINCEEVDREDVPFTKIQVPVDLTVE